MRNSIFLSLVLLILSLLPVITHAQKSRKVSLGESQLLGNWKVTDAIKAESVSSISVCDYKTFKVTNDSITINSSSLSRFTVPYFWDMEKEIYKIVFKEGAVDYQFYFTKEYLILQNISDKNGCLLLLKKTK